MQNENNYLRKQSLINGGSNAVFNGIFAWLFVRSREQMPVWANDGIALDFPATALILVFIVTLIVVPSHRKKFANGDLATLPIESDFWSGVVRRLPVNTAMLGVVLGLAAALIFAPPALLIFELAGVSALSPMQFAVVKGLWAGVMAACIVPPMIWTARATAPQPANHAEESRS